MAATQQPLGTPSTQREIIHRPTGIVLHSLQAQRGTL